MPSKYYIEWKNVIYYMVYIILYDQDTKEKIKMALIFLEVVMITRLPEEVHNVS